LSPAPLARTGTDAFNAGWHVAVEIAHKIPLSSHSDRARYCCGIAALLVCFACQASSPARAEGETRTISLHHVHTNEDLTVTYKRNGRYDPEALQKINYLLRDWREHQPVNMDPQVIDLLWEVQREVGAKEPIWVICGYRSPGTNAMLRQRSSGVAKFSQHMNGKAVDFFIPGVPLEELRAAGLRAQRGGVGIYTSSHFVHLDTGSVRHWPRMPEEQLARVLAKGQLASHFASDNGAAAAPAAGRRLSFFARLFGGGRDAEEQTASAPAAKTAPSKDGQPAAKPPAASLAAAKPARADAHQVASAASKPVAKPATFQLASAAAIPLPVIAEADHDEVDAAAKAPVGASSESAPEPARPLRLAQASGLVAPGSTVSANDVVSERGYWQGLPGVESAQAPPPAAPRVPAQAVRRPAAAGGASADPATTASLAPWPFARPADSDSMPSALAYAAQPTPIAAARPLPMGSANPRASPGESASTHLARSKDDGRVAAAPAKPRIASVVKVGDHFNDPWLRAMIVSPSAQSFMRTTLFGAQDFRSLGAQMYKPAAAVAITFSGNPSPGLTTDQFAGDPVVFVQTVSFGTRRAGAR
jgi:uncharacterized protein YcbK (DUF882 family)